VVWIWGVILNNLALITLDQYLSEHLSSTVMITLKIDNKEPFQYNYWNSFPDQLHLLHDDYRIGHILHKCNILLQEDGSFLVQSEYHPKNCVINFYFGGAIP
jgi:hypothetical protein